MYTSICWYLRVLPVFHRPDVVDIGVNTSNIEKTCHMPKGLHTQGAEVTAQLRVYDK